MRKTGADPERGDRSTRKFSMRLRLQCQSIIEDVRVLALVSHPRIALATEGPLAWGILKRQVVPSSNTIYFDM